ncbi:hypothetical protein HYY70_04570 [Candidatus Woesearchaeota archaeon]|nr:hypothetical protein [Candidatus Woesearchaeota archaeon]
MYQCRREIKLSCDDATAKAREELAKEDFRETAIGAGILIFVFVLLLLTIQSATGHRSWVFSSVLSLIILGLFFSFTIKQAEKGERIVHKDNPSR